MAHEIIIHSCHSGFLLCWKSTNPEAPFTQKLKFRYQAEIKCQLSESSNRKGVVPPTVQ